jgi:hypothetical protein
VSDNRRATRFSVSIAATLTFDGKTIDGTLLNLSLGGTLVASAVKHPMGQRIDISFRVPTAEQAIEVGTTVRWADAAGVGLQFDGLRARDVWALNEYFKRLP